MPGHFGQRHAMQAWGTCDPKNDEYTIGDSSKPLPQVTGRIPCRMLSVYGAGAGVVRKNSATFAVAPCFHSSESPAGAYEYYS